MKYTLALALFVTIASEPLSAKGDTSKVVIVDTATHNSIEVADTAVLRKFQIWSGPGTASNGVPQAEGFIADWPAGAVEQLPFGLHHYEVSFFVRTQDGGEEVAYAVDYDCDQSEGYVFIPGRGDPRFGRNVRSILRRLEGRWFRATTAWQDFFSAQSSVVCR